MKKVDLFIEFNTLCATENKNKLSKKVIYDMVESLTEALSEGPDTLKKALKCWGITMHTKGDTYYEPHKALAGLCSVGGKHISAEMVEALAKQMNIKIGDIRTLVAPFGIHIGMTKMEMQKSANKVPESKLGAFGDALKSALIPKNGKATA